ncbi:MAG: sulfurtransferase TusA family protein [Gammaproteobacteria bacterium]|nr:sulfurtransferase TusA family protein [Gammaproteobacteria bacterium]
MSQHQLDVRNLLCPMPVIRTQNHVKTLTVGETLEITATDPGVKADIPAWCRINGHSVLDISEQGRDITIRIEVGERNQSR